MKRADRGNFLNINLTNERYEGVAFDTNKFFEIEKKLSYLSIINNRKKSAKNVDDQFRCEISKRDNQLKEEKFNCFRSLSDFRVCCD